MHHLFKCKTSEAYHIKILAELLTNNLKVGSFDITEEKISLEMIDEPLNTFIDLKLFSENFSMYKFKSKEKICMGLNFNHLHKMLKSIKKKDSLELFITTENPKELGIKTIPKENTRVTVSYLTIQTIQNLDIGFPYGYGKPVIVSSIEFQKMCKDLSSIGSHNIQVSVKNFCINFTADADGILKRKVTFGENEDSDNEDEEVNSYEASFSTDQLVRISKLAGLSSNIQIFSCTNLALLFRTNIGSLGKISVYIKSKELLEKESLNYSSDEEN